MSNDNSKQTRRKVLQQGAVAGGVFALGAGAFAGGAAADKPDIDRSVEVTISNPCTGEDATDTDPREVIDIDSRRDNSGGLHINLKFSGKGRFSERIRARCTKGASVLLRMYTFLTTEAPR